MVPSWLEVPKVPCRREGAEIADADLVRCRCWQPAARATSRGRHNAAAGAHGRPPCVDRSERHDPWERRTISAAPRRSTRGRPPARRAWCSGPGRGRAIHAAVVGWLVPAAFMAVSRGGRLRDGAASIIIHPRDEAAWVVEPAIRSGRTAREGTQHGIGLYTPDSSASSGPARSRSCPAGG